MTEEEYLARLGLLRPQSGKRKPQEPVPPGSSVLDVPIGGTRRIPDTVLRRQYEGPNVGEATPYDPTLRERLAAKTQDVFEGLGADRYKARQRAETILGGPSSNLPLHIGLADFAPFLGTTIQTEEAGRGLEQAGRDIQRGDYLSAGIEGLGAGLGLLPGLSATAKGAKAVGKRVREAADPEAIRQYVRQTQGLTGMPGTAVIKPKGGNWLEGSIEKSTSKWTEDLEPMNLGEITERNGVRRAQEMLRQYQESPRYRQQNAINKWVDKKLNKYIRNEMATPEDPVRKLIEDTGASHIPFEETWQPESLVARRKAVGFPEEGLAAQKYNQSFGSATPQTLENLTRAAEWESRTDQVIENLPAKEWLNLHGYHKVSNPWLTEIDPKTMVYRPSRVQIEDDLGFDHLIDELRNAIAPNSDLPANLRWKPEDLDKVTMAQAVERVSKINDWRAAQMEAAKKAAREGIPVHKQYEGGYQWMAAPDTAKDPKSLKYIQDVGCESGWCTQGESLAKQYGGGGNQLYVLHDPDGKSVVQISVRPMDDSTFQRQVDWKQYSALQDISQSEADKWLAQQRQSMPSEIVEIKGKQNRPPKDEHLPMVQDFVRSGKWSRVGDIQNTGMRPTSSVFNENELRRLREAGAGDIPQALTGEDIQRLHNLITPEGKRLKYDAKGNIVGSEDAQNYAVGGLVQNTDTLRDKLIAAGMDPEQAMMQGLRMAEQVEMQAGGLASKTLKGAFRGAEKAIPRIETKGFQEFRADAPFIRAEEASKHQFETGKPVIVESYTGTRRDFSEIDPGLSSAGYFSSNKPIVANEYAGVFPEGALSQPFPTGGNIQKSFIRMDNPLFINARGASFNRVDTRGLPGFGLPMSNTDMINLWAKQQGYDGVVYKDLRDSMALPSGQNAPASNVYVSFKPNYVKSAIGNRGTYDVKERDMTKAEGGLL